MLSIIHYISAQRRLTEAEKTVIMMGGKYDEREVPEMVLAQRDMIKLERDYYRDKAIDTSFIVALSIFVGLIGYYVYHFFMRG